MKKDTLETKVKKAILRIENRVLDIYNALNDMNLKLHHIIQNSRSAEDIYYDMIHEKGEPDY